ncbi:hypothetical protein [Actinacidiphila yanglinensis]|uniref:hypothetical protein n=1 Tax=Actinacidiphila yanglinensis TaxID=310779 RepID=UPI000CDE5FAB|nr:hypothetical protein [Actinacidiphila yanglinensis]
MLRISSSLTGLLVSWGDRCSLARGAVALGVRDVGECVPTWLNRKGLGWLLLQIASVSAVGVCGGLCTALLQPRHSSWPTLLFLIGAAFVLMTVSLTALAWRNGKKAAR